MPALHLEVGIPLPQKTSHNLGMAHEENLSQSEAEIDCIAGIALAGCGDHGDDVCGVQGSAKTQDGDSADKVGGI